MRLNDFATLQRGELIEVKENKAGFSVWEVVSEPLNATMIRAVNIDTKKRGLLYFRDVIQRRKR